MNNEPRLQPDYAHDANDTLAIVPNGEPQPHDEVARLNAVTTRALIQRYANENAQLRKVIDELQAANQKLIARLEECGLQNATTAPEG